MCHHRYSFFTTSIASLILIMGTLILVWSSNVTAAFTYVRSLTHSLWVEDDVIVEVVGLVCVWSDKLPEVIDANLEGPSLGIWLADRDGSSLVVNCYTLGTQRGSVKSSVNSLIPPSL